MARRGYVEGRQKSAPKLKNWAIGTDGEEWWLFQWFPNKRRLCERGQVEIPSGNVSLLAETLAAEGGHLSKEDAIRLFRTEIPDRQQSLWTDQKVFDSKCKPTRQRLANLLKSAVGQVSSQEIEEDPIPWKHRYD